MSNLEEKWKDEILESLDSIEKAKPNPFLYAKIERRLETLKVSGRMVEMIPFRYVSIAAAVLFILSFLNVWTIQSSWIRKSQQLYSSEVPVEQDASFGQNFNLYE